VYFGVVEFEFGVVEKRRSMKTGAWTATKLSKQYSLLNKLGWKEYIFPLNFFVYHNLPLFASKSNIRRGDGLGKDKTGVKTFVRVSKREDRIGVLIEEHLLTN